MLLKVIIMKFQNHFHYNLLCKFVGGFYECIKKQFLCILKYVKEHTNNFSYFDRCCNKMMAF